MQPSLASGAATVVNSTTAESSHRPLRPRPIGPENKSATWTCPAVLTDIRVVLALISSSTKRGEVQRERHVQRIVVRVPQHGVAAQAVCPGAGRERRHDLELAAIAALAQARRRHRQGGVMRGNG